MRLLLLLLLCGVFATGAEVRGIPTMAQAALKARKLLSTAGSGVVASVDATGFPYAATEIYGTPSVDGNPLFLMSPMEVNMQNIQADKWRCALSVQHDAHNPGTGAFDPLLDGRVSLQGRLAAVPAGEHAAARAAFLSLHPEAKEWIDLKSHMFSLFYMNVSAVHWTGGFGDTHFIGDIDLSVWRAAVPPLDATTEAALQPTFPRKLQYTVELSMKRGGIAPAGSVFTGSHSFDADANWGLVSWTIAEPTGDPYPFLMAFDGASKLVHQVVGKAGADANCSTFEYPVPVFEEKWAENATYAGTSWFQTLDNGLRMAHRWDGVVPFFVQGQQFVSSFYSDFFTGAPLAYINDHLHMLYARNPTTTVQRARAVFGPFNTMKCTPQ